MVFPHRECGFAAVAAPIPVYGWDFSRELLQAASGRQWDKVEAGLNPASPAALAIRRVA
jgi:hypothetical protein